MKRFLKIVGIFILSVFIFVIVFISYNCIKQKVWLKDKDSYDIKLTSKQMEEDFIYFTKIVKDTYPFGEYVSAEKGLENINKLDNEYITRAKACKSNKEFMSIFKEYLTRLGQAGHANILTDRDLKTNNSINDFINRWYINTDKEAINRTVYWNLLFNESTKSAYCNLDIKYLDGNYTLINDYYIDKNNNKMIPKNSVIVKINNIGVDEYIKTLQNRTYLKYDPIKNKPYNYNLFSIDDTTNMDYWDISLKLPNGDVCKYRISKIYGKRPQNDDTDTSVYSSSNVVCCELSQDVGYIKIFSFNSKFINNDRKLIQGFMNKSQGKYKKLIIDIRRNPGGDPYYWMNLLVQPIIKNTITYEEKAAFKKDFIKRESLRFYAYKYSSSALISKRYNTVEVKQITDKNFNPKDWTIYSIKREIKPENSYNFNGKVYVLIDSDCFSAADDFSAMIKRTKFATLIGTNTGGGNNAFMPSPIYTLPNSKITFKLESELNFTIDGKVNEPIGTYPDIWMEKSTYPTAYPTRYDVDSLKKDLWIKSVLMNEYR